MTSPDILDDAAEIDEIIALVFDQTGEDGLRELMARLSGVVDQQILLDAANKLEVAGLSDAAAIVGEAAEQTGDKDAELIADILCDPVRGNAKARLAALFRRGEIDLDGLAAAGAGADVIEYVSRCRGHAGRQYVRAQDMGHLLNK